MMISSFNKTKQLIAMLLYFHFILFFALMGNLRQFHELTISDRPDDSVKIPALEKLKSVHRFLELLCRFCGLIKAIVVALTWNAKLLSFDFFKNE